MTRLVSLVLRYAYSCSRNCDRVVDFGQLGINLQKNSRSLINFFEQHRFTGPSENMKSMEKFQANECFIRYNSAYAI